MKKILLGGKNSKKTEVTIMNEKEVLRFLKNKNVYHWSINWIERWNPNSPVTDLLKYFPYKGFTLPKRVKLQYYDPSYVNGFKDRGYSAQCLSTKTVSGRKTIYDYDRYKISIRKSKNATLYYVTKIRNLFEK